MSILNLLSQQTPIVHKSQHKDYPISLPSYAAGRRRFLKHVSILTLASQMPWLISGCQPQRVLNTGGHLTQVQALIADFTFQFLLPDDGFGPSSIDQRTYLFFLWVLDDTHFDSDQQKYYIQGMDWAEETSMEEYNQSFTSLDGKDKTKLFHLILRTNWGESWLASMMTIVIESMLCDPIYGSNPNGETWKWLSYNTGQPQPVDFNRYPSILDRQKERVHIKSRTQL